MKLSKTEIKRDIGIEEHYITMFIVMKPLND
jgi:hypothetical protein